MRFCEFSLIIMLGILNLAKLTESVLGCVTIMIGAKGKQCICSKLTTKFTRIPFKLPDFVVKLEVKNQNIHSLTSDQLTQVEWLEDLNLDTNKLSSIDTDAFINVQKLLHLSLKNNFLILGGNSFPSAALLQLKNLKSLDLENNPLGFVPDFFFQPLKVLQKLILSRAPNGFYLEPNSLAGLTSLETLDLSMSHLTSLDKQIQTAFNNMQLLELFLFGNRWNCDCNLKWLKKWWLKYKEVKISKKFKRANGETGIAQPQCFTPNRLKGHNIFEISTEYDTIKLNDLYCPPKIFTKNQQIQIDHGKNLTLTCEFEADPGGNVEWSKNGMIVQKHWKRTRWGQTSGMRFTAWLSITRTEVEDNGLWRCILITDIEKANATFSLRVRHSFSPAIDLTIILKYIGIGAITLILLLVIIGIAIYCVYGFRIRPFVKQHKTLNSSEMDRGIRPTRSDGENNHADNNVIRPLMVNALVNKDKRQTEEDLNKYCNNDDSQKCLLLPSSPALVIPITNQSIINNSSHFPCPLHGNINFIDHSAFSGNKQHSTIDYINSIGFIQPHTLPRQNNRTLTRVKTNPVFIQPSNHQSSNNCISCPLHGNIIASLQRQDEDDNINSIYSTFFSPRHSQPLINNNNSRFESDIRNARMTNSVGENFQILSTKSQIKEIPTMSAISSFPSIPLNATNRPPPNAFHSSSQKPHDDEGYSTSV